jgi:hypothetical protein
MFGMKNKHKKINIFRQCLDCGYEQFELDEPDWRLGGCWEKKIVKAHWR